MSADRWWIRRLRLLATAEGHLIGCSLFRIGVGILLLWYYLTAWPVRRFLWSADGVFPPEVYDRFLAMSQSPSLFAVRSRTIWEFYYVTGILCAVLFMLGWRTRWVVLPFVVLSWSLLNRNAIALSGGDNLLQVTLPYVLFLDSGARLSLDRRRAQRAAQSPVAAQRPAGDGRWPLLALTHNGALICLIVQLALVYGISAVHKLTGEPWRDGSALSSILRVHEFAPPGWLGFLVGATGLLALMTYATLAFEAAYPFLALTRRTRPVAALGAVLLHTGIAAVMGLHVFAATMIVFQLLLLDDAQYRRGLAGARWIAKPVVAGGHPASPPH